MSAKEMRALLAELGKEAAQHIDRPAAPLAVMHAFCRAMGVRVGRPVDLDFVEFPVHEVTGMRLDCGDRSLIIVEKRAVPESQLVILGHELWHEEQGGCGHHIAGLAAAARASFPADGLMRLVAEHILAMKEVPEGAMLAGAARADSFDREEEDAETFGLLFGREARTWMTGRYAQGPVRADTVEGRINLSLGNRGRIL